MAQYSLDPIADNCYPNSAVLINKYGIRDEADLLDLEIAVTQEAVATWERLPLCATFDFAHYKAIHRHLFGELYEWAGEVRAVNISKKGTRFCDCAQIESVATKMFARLDRMNRFKGLPRERFVGAFVDFYVAANDLHPFREGNGRTQRVFMSQLAINAGYRLDFSAIDSDELMIATIQSAQGVTDGLHRIFEKELTSNLMATLKRHRKATDRYKQDRVASEGAEGYGMGRRRQKRKDDYDL